MKKLVLLKDIAGHLPKAIRIEIQKAVKDYNAATIQRIEVKQQEPKIEPSKRGGTIYLSTRHVDTTGDIVMPNGWDLSYYEKTGSKLLWSHNANLLPLGAAEWTKPDEMGLKQFVKFADHQMAEDCWQLFKGGFLQTFSAGFHATASMRQGEQGFSERIQALSAEWPEIKTILDKIQRVISKQVLFESSLCNLPCNPYCMAQEVSKGTLTISDTMKQAIHLEDIIKKGVDEGALEMTGTTVSMKAKEGDGRWITTDSGMRVFIAEGQDPKEAVDAAVAEREGKKPKESGGDKKPPGGYSKPKPRAKMTIDGTERYLRERGMSLKPLGSEPDASGKWITRYEVRDKHGNKKPLTAAEVGRLLATDHDNLNDFGKCFAGDDDCCIITDEEPKTIEIKSVIQVIEYPITVKRVVTQDAILDIIGSQLRNTIAKMRGAV